MAEVPSRSSVEAAGHAVVAALRAVHEALDAVSEQDWMSRPTGWVSMAGSDPAELREAVRLGAEIEGRLSGLRLHAVAAADTAHAYDDCAETDTSAWAAKAAVNRARSWGGVWLADLLDRKYADVRAGLASGRIGEEHAEIIVRAAEKIPAAIGAAVSPNELAECERVLVEKAEHLNPRRLRRAARRLLEPLSKRLADVHEGELLAERERYAERLAALAFDDNGDGTWSGRFTIPELHAHLLKNALERLSAPRRLARVRGEEGTDHTVVDETVPTHRSNRFEQMGTAFCELLEHLPTDGHARTGVTLVVHIDEDKLREGIGAAGLDTGAVISAGDARRLACDAGILPMVLVGASQPLDLGPTQRLFTKAQALALSAMHDECAAQECERPFAWCELHHKIHWAEGGVTDLANAVPLCGHHHRRIHEPVYQHEWLPDGTVRFRHRWRSRHHAHDAWEKRAIHSTPAA